MSPADGENPVVFIEVRGGIVQAVYASAPIDVTIADHDTDGDIRALTAERIAQAKLDAAIAADRVAEVNVS